jgi:hypothetical protein
MPNAMRIARYSNPVAAITAEYERSFNASLVVMIKPMVVTVHMTQNQVSKPL